MGDYGLAFSRRFISRSTASCRNAVRVSPSSRRASMRANVPAGNRPGMLSKFSFGRPMRECVSDISTADKLISPIDAQSDICFITDIKYGDKSMAVSPGGYTDDFGPNVSQILVHGTRKIIGRVPARVRAELRAAVAAGVLKHMPKDGLKPEIFYHPDRRNSALEIRRREAEYAVECIAGVVGFNPETRGFGSAK